MDIEQLGGTRLGNYEIESLLGRGGMGVVYKATQISLSRSVALKFLPPELIDSREWKERFHREAQAAAALAHPNICTIHEINEADDKVFIAMEYLEGQSLDKKIESGPLDIDEAINIAVRVAEGLWHAHDRGIIHRDIKPANIMLTKYGQTKIMDFGLAKLSGKTRLTKTATVMGTVDYMSPEQAHGETAIDHRTDIWSLGVLMYEMLGGRLPFDAPSDAGVIHKIVYEEPQPLGNIRADIPLALEQAIKKTLQKEPSERYEDMSALIKDLQAIRKDPAAALVSEELVGPAVGRRTPFVGREAEREELRGFLNRAKSGNGALVMLGGEPGVGKTRMTEELEAEAHRHGFLTLTGHCYEMEGAPSYIPFIEILQSLMRTIEPDILLETLGDAAPEAAKLEPELRERFPDIPEPRKLPPEHERLYLFNKLSAFFGRLANHRPLLLIIEDLHWTDDSTLLLLQHIAQRLGEVPVLMVGTYRDTELDVARSLAKALEELLRQRLAHDLLLKRLPLEHVTAMLRGRSGQEPPPRLINLIFDETEGNPFFIEEVFNYLAEEEKLFDPEGKWRGDVRIEEWEVPRGVLLVIGRRLERVSDECRRILARAAVIGRGIGFNLLHKVIELDEDALFDAIEEAEKAQLISTTIQKGEDRITFVHELIRQTLLNDLSASRRQRLHLRVAETMEQLYAGALEHHAADLAYHFYQGGGDSEKIITYSVMAAERATAQTAYEEAIALYERALEEVERQHPTDEMLRCDVMLALGITLEKAGDPLRAEEIFLSTIDLALKLKAPKQLAEALLPLSNIRYTAGITDEFILDLAEQGLSVMPSGESIPKARLLATLSILYQFDQESMERRTSLSAQAIAMARRLGDKQAIKEALFSQALLWKRPIMERVADLEELLDLSEESGDFSFVDLPLCYLFSIYTEIADLSSADATEARLRELSTEFSSPISLWVLKTIEVMRALMAGRFEEAERLVFEAFAEGQKWNETNTPLQFAASMFFLRQLQGRLAEIEESFLSQVEMYPDMPALRAASAYLHFALGRERKARAAFDDLANGDFKDIPQDNLVMAVFNFLTILACRLGDTQRATLLYDLLTPHSGHLLMVGSPAACLGAVTHFLGMLAGTLKRWDDAVEHFEAALETNSSIGARPYLAQTQQEYARMLIDRDSTGDEQKARALLSESIAICRELGMPSFLKEAEDLMERI